MSARAEEKNLSPELAVVGTVGGTGESFGEKEGGKFGNWGDVGVAVMGAEVLVEGEVNNTDSNGVAEILPRDSVKEGVGPSGDRIEEWRVGEVEEKVGADRKVEEGEVLEEVLVVGAAFVDDVAGGEVKVNEEKGSDGDGLVIAASDAIEGYLSNSDVVSGSLEKEVNTLAVEKYHMMNDALAMPMVKSMEGCCSDENVTSLKEGNLENSEKVCGAEEKGGSVMVVDRKELVKDGQSLDGDEMGVTASDAIEEHVLNAEIVGGNTKNGAFFTNAEPLESGVTTIDGGATIDERNDSGNTEAYQVLWENDQDHRVSELVASNFKFNPGESEIDAELEIQLTGSVDTEIDGKGNEMYSGPSDCGVKATEDKQPCFEEMTVTDVAHADPNSVHMEVDDAFMPSDTGLHDGDAMEVHEQDNGAEDLEMVEEEEVHVRELKTESCRGVDEAVYQLPPDAENEFVVSDLVWGKVRSHPWWPGQIFDPSDASETAMTYHKKDSFLVAYFGDHTFAWNEAPLLKPFRSYFSNAVRQSNTEEFQNAVDCALEEVSRRAELGLACSCLSKDVVDEIKVQVIENVGIRPDSCTIESVYKFAEANSFKPYEFLRYVKALAQSPSSETDRLELVMAKAQLLAIYRHKGFYHLPDFQCFGDLVEDDAEALDTKDSIQASDVKDGMVTSAQGSVGAPKSSSHRRKHNLKDIVYHRRKERSLFELMDEAMIYSEDDEFESDGTLLSKRRRGFDLGVDSGSMAKGISSSTTPYLPKPSFKIGECISRVASQMTRSPSLKSQIEGGVGHVEGAADMDDVERGKASVAAECQSLQDLLSQLQSIAINPMGGYSSFNEMTCFFSDVRNSVAVGLDLSVANVGGKRKKSSQYAGGSSEAFEFEDMNDFYWTDRTVGNGFEDNPDELVNGEKQLISFEHKKPRKAGRRPYTRRRDIEVSKPLPEKPVGYVDPNSPAELVMTFPEPRFIPSEVSLNKTFKRFGPLNVLQTELDRDGNRSRVVFKKCSDAEVACSSASKFKIFGSLVVNYQLNYKLSDPFTTYYKPVPLPEASSETPEDNN